MPILLLILMLLSSALAQNYTIEIIVNNVPVAYSIESGSLDGDLVFGPLQGESSS